MSFREALRAAGLLVHEVIEDGDIHRCGTAQKPKSKNGWYLAFDDGKAGVYGDWQTGDGYHYWSDGTTSREYDAKRHDEIKKRREAEQKAAALRAAEYIEGLPLDGKSPYLDKKGIQPHGVKFDGEVMIVPVQDADGRIWSYQRIYANSDKYFMSGGRTKGCFYMIGKPQSVHQRVIVCEGFATGASIHEATGYPVAVAFYASNLKPVCDGLPYRNIVVAADNDASGEGERRAIETGHPYVMPPEVGQDFSDLFMAGEDISQLFNLTAGFPLVYADDVQPVTHTSDFVEDLLCENQFSVIYGESNCGKTFFMMDLALHVALGRQWRGKEVDGGGVIYAALEGGHGTRNRVHAFREYHKVRESIPLAIIPSSINFLDETGKDIDLLVLSIHEAQKRLGRVKLIVIDTLSRALSGGDENSSQDMGRLIIVADKIREITGAHIAFIHHSGKDALKGARGHSSLRAAVDTEIEISRQDKESPSVIKVVKQREMEMGEDMAFKLHRVELGTNQRGKVISSCVVLPDTLEKQEKAKPVAAMTPVQKFIYEALIEAIERCGTYATVVKGEEPVNCVTYDELREVLEERGYKKVMETENKTTAEQIKSATQTARLALKKMGRINFNASYLWVNYYGE